MISIKELVYASRKYSLKSVLINVFSIATSDFVIVSFQKCGKTWLRVMLAKVLSKEYGIKKLKLDLQFMTLFHPRFPNILISHAGSTKDNNKINFTKIYKKKKIIFLVRDPRDIVVSLFHGSRTRDKVYDGEDISLFIKNQNCGFQKIINFMNLWAQEMSKRPKDFIVIKYEDLKNDAANELKKIFDFVKIEVKNEIIDQAVAYGSFDNMRKMEMAGVIKDYRMKPGNVNDPNSFRTRKGKVGGYKEELSEEDINYMEELMSKKLNPFFDYMENI